MKLLILIPFISFFTINTWAQSKNPTNQKEIDARMKQAQDALDRLTPEQRKMMEEMGMSTKLPAKTAAVAGATDAQIAGTVNKDGVPAKNALLIAAIPKITLTTANLASYIGTLNDYINKNLSTPAKQAGQDYYTELKRLKYNADEIANVAIGFWTTGQLELAVSLEGRACAEKNMDDDMLSNFAAMLSMGGAPHLAIPLLEYLNKIYPDNTTIQNNLGQAWFYLGDVDKANVQLDKVVKAFAYHPQANYTQCLIQQSKGNKSGAIEKMKNSLAYSYSLDKVNMLRKLGFSVKATDMRMPFRPDPDPLGLRKFMRPDVPTSYDDELRLQDDWDEFQKQVNDKSMELGKSLVPYQQANAMKGQNLYNQYTKAKGDVSKMKTTDRQSENLYRKTAEKKLEAMKKDGGAAYRLTKAKAAIDIILKNFMTKDEAQRKEIEKANSLVAQDESELAKKGEDLGYDNCVVQKKYSEWVYANYNKPLEEAYKEYLHQLYLKITEELYWKQFIQDVSDFEATKINAKKEWLSALSNTRYIATNKYGECETETKKESGYKLSDFDDMHCAFVTILDFGVYKQIFECGKARIEFDAGKLSGEFNFNMDNNGNNKFVKSILEATIINKDISVKKGPIQIGATVKAGAGIEITQRGIEDVYVTGKASVNVKSNFIDKFDEHIKEANGNNSNQPGMDDAQLSDKGVEIGVNGRMSLISGNASTNVFVNTPK